MLYSYREVHGRRFRNGHYYIASFIQIGARVRTETGGMHPLSFIPTPKIDWWPLTGQRRLVNMAERMSHDGISGPGFL